MTTTMHFDGPDFTLEVPQNWFITSSALYQAVFIAPPVDAGPGSNLSIIVRHVIEPTDLETVAEAARQVQQSNYQDYTILSEQELMIADLPALLRVQRWYNPENDMTIVQQQLYLVRHPHLFYTLTATRPAQTDQQDVEQLDQEFAAMFASFQVKPLEEVL